MFLLIAVLFWTYEPIQFTNLTTKWYILLFTLTCMLCKWKKKKLRNSDFIGKTFGFSSILNRGFSCWYFFLIVHTKCTYTTIIFRFHLKTFQINVFQVYFMSSLFWIIKFSMQMRMKFTDFYEIKNIFNKKFEAINRCKDDWQHIYFSWL